MHSIFMLYPQCTLRAISCPSSTTHPSFFLGIEMREKVSYTVKSFFFYRNDKFTIKKCIHKSAFDKEGSRSTFLEGELRSAFLKGGPSFFFPFRKMMYF
jgi:hypothetical protein